MKDETVSVFYRIYNSFPSIENSRENERAFDCLPFTYEMNLQASIILAFKISQSEIS